MENTNKTPSKEELYQSMGEGIANVRDKKTTTFETDNILPSWSDYSAVSKFKSVRRAIRRGHVDLFTGIIYPKRPFSNKKRTKGRRINELKKQIYGTYKRAV